LRSLIRFQEAEKEAAEQERIEKAQTLPALVLSALPIAGTTATVEVKRIL